jgi:hypothetical protein
MRRAAWYSCSSPQDGLAAFSKVHCRLCSRTNKLCMAAKGRFSFERTSGSASARKTEEGGHRPFRVGDSTGS